MIRLTQNATPLEFRYFKSQRGYCTTERLCRGRPKIWRDTGDHSIYIIVYSSIYMPDYDARTRVDPLLLSSCLLSVRSGHSASLSLRELHGVVQIVWLADITGH